MVASPNSTPQPNTVSTRVDLETGEIVPLPPYQLLPLLDDDRYAQLKTDIAARGVLVPVEYDSDGNILDGHHRVRAWQELTAEGVKMPDYPRVVRQFADEHAKRLHVRALNVLRRDLTKEQRNEQIVAMRQEGASYRQIADAIGVGPATAMRAVNLSTVSDETVDLPATVKGKDGKRRAAKKKATPEAPLSLFVVDNSATPKAVKKAAERKQKAEQHEASRAFDGALVSTLDDALAAANGLRYQTVVIDPPWDWGDEGDVNQFGRAKPTYATMPIHEIAALPVDEIAAPDAHLYLWITNRSLPKGFALLEGWGFRYVTMLTWVKPSFGMGNYYRGSTEHVLFGVRGSLPLLRRDVGTHFEAPRGQHGHSAKPDEFYRLIETCSPGPRIDMFARTERPGWVVWGNVS